MFKTIRNKMTFFVLLILCTMWGIQLLTDYIFAEKYYLDRRMTAMQKAFEEIKKLPNGNPEGMVEVMNTYEEYDNLNFVVANSSLVCIYNSRQYSFKEDKNKYKIRPGFDFEKNIKQFSTEPITRIKMINENTEKLRLCGIIEYKDGQRYYIVIRTSLNAMWKELDETSLFTFYISGIALICGVCLTYMVSRKFTKPIEEIGFVAQHVAQLNFSMRAKEKKSNDEISCLAKSINQMSDSLEHNIKVLQETNKQLELDNDKMAKVDLMRKEFVANVSHELKTPIAILTGYAEMLKSDIQGIDKEFYYDVILDESYKMKTLISNLLELSLIENGLANIKLEQVNLSQFAEDFMKKNAIFLEEKQIDVQVKIEQDKWVMGNIDYLERVFTNYINNAVEHTKPCHKIELSLKKMEENTIMLSVFNEGEPIPKEAFSCIWESFYRTDKARTRTEQNNIGLGLYIVRVIMQAHHGLYGAVNEENGVRFFISLSECYKTK